MAGNEVSFRIFGRNDSRRAFREAEDDFETFRRYQDGRLRDTRGRFISEGRLAGQGWGDGIGRGRSGLDRLASAASSMGKKLRESLAPIAEVGVKIAGIGSAAVGAGPLLVPVAKALFTVGQAAVNASPALLSFAAAGLFVKATLGQIFKEGSAMRQALQPLADRFNQAGEAASRAAAKGVRPLIEQFNKLNMPAVQSAMVHIGNAVNKVTTGFLKWANSAEGVKAIKGIVGPIGKSMEQLAPHITKVATSFVSMLGRITGVSMAAGTKGLAGALDHLAKMFDKISAKSVGGGIGKLKSTFETVKGVVEKVVGWVKKAVDVYKEYQTKFKYLADAIALVAMYFGGPVTAIVAGVGLIIRHWDDLKRAYESVKKYFSSPIGKGVMDDLKHTAETIGPALKKAFQGIAKDVGPELKDIGHKITHDLIPAFADFMDKAAPVAAWIIEKLGPVIGQNLKGTFEVIGGLIEMLSGLFEIASGILSGDWSKIWDGLKKAFGKEGLGKIIQGGLRAAFAPVIPLLKTTGRKIKEAWHTITDSFSGTWDKITGSVGKVKDAVGDAAHWIGKLKGKTVKIAQKGAAAVQHAVEDVIGWIRRFKGKAVKIAQHGAAAASHAVKDVINWIKRFKGKAVSVAVHGASAAVHAVKDLIHWISNIVGKTVNVGVNVVGAAKHLLGFATGGIVTAATGGARSDMVMVGEQGPELVRLPRGSQVYPHGQSMGMAAAMGGGGVAKLEIEWVGGRGGDQFIEWLRENIRIKAGTGAGSVQKALGA